MSVPTHPELAARRFGAAGKAGLYYAALGREGQSMTPAVALVAGSALPTVHESVVARAGASAVAAFDAAATSAASIVVAFTVPSGERPALRLARVALPEADY